MDEKTRKERALIDLHQNLASGRIAGQSGVDIVDLIHLGRYRFALAYTAEKNVLDIACGIGYGTHMIARGGGARAATGIDVSRDAISQAEQTYRHPALRFHLLDGKVLPFSDHTFDTVVSFETIEHVFDERFFLQELRRVMKRGGSLVISTPNKRFHSFGRRIPWNPYHVREHTPERFRRLLEQYYSRIEFWGGQEFLAPNILNAFRTNWIEFRYYKVLMNPAFARMIQTYRRIRRKTEKQHDVSGNHRDAGLPRSLIEHRCDVRSWIENTEPYTIVAVCRNED
ncbi:MAG: class I SAM-dependent methyltransferase [Ignavibacteria bacterium]|nr:class I SAM-dependent methyltransferase [Ignavibacteria bacterium]